MKSRMILAGVVAALVGMPVGALALRHSAVDRNDGVITRSSDDDGTADQGHGDAPGTAGSTVTTSPSDDDGTADQGHGDAPGTAGFGDDDSGARRPRASLGQ